MAQVTTRPCIGCGEVSTLQVDDLALESYRSGALAQDAFPEWTNAQREVLISGTHPACWDELFAEAEEAEDHGPGCDGPWNCTCPPSDDTADYEAEWSDVVAD